MEETQTRLSGDYDGLSAFSSQSISEETQTRLSGDYDKSHPATFNRD